MARIKTNVEMAMSYIDAACTPDLMSKQEAVDFKEEIIERLKEDVECLKEEMQE